MTTLNPFLDNEAEEADEYEDEEDSDEDNEQVTEPQLLEDTSVTYVLCISLTNWNALTATRIYEAENLSTFKDLQADELCESEGLDAGVIVNLVESLHINDISE